MARARGRTSKPKPDEHLRDMFAAAALTGMLANNKETQNDDELVESAYTLADLMLEERDRDPEEDDED